MSMQDVKSKMKGGAGLVQALRDAGYHHFAAAIEAGQQPAPTPAPATTSPMPQPTAMSRVPPQNLKAMDTEVRQEGNLERKKALEEKRQKAVDTAEAKKKGYVTAEEAEAQSKRETEDDGQ